MSGAAEASTSGTSRTKDGIPTWGGEASSFVQYEEAALLWEQSLTWEKRYTAGPRLVQELTGAARRFVSGQPAGWVAYRGGVEVLMDHLRKALGKPRVNEVTDLLATYFKGTKRRSGESMNEFITRKTEAYMRANQALRRVQPHYESETAIRTYGNPGWREGRRGSDSTWSRQWTPATEAEETPLHASEEGTSTTGGSTRPPEDGTEPEEAWRSYSGSPWDPYGGWGWSSGWSSYWSSWDWKASSAASTTSQDSSSQELLPTFIQGWYLLMDASLDHGERNLVVTALNGNFHPQRVGQELRNQFPESETRRRDQGRRFQSYMGEIAEDADEDLYEDGNTTVELEAEGLNAEGVALVVDAEQEAQSALVALQEAKRTLKDARFKQKQVKMNRKYYQGGNRGFKTGGTFFGRPRDDSNIECLGCGQKGHRVANCPNKAPATAASTDHARGSGDDRQQAPFVCFVEKTESSADSPSSLDGDFVGFAQVACATTPPVNKSATAEAETKLSTLEAVRRGMCVIDGGATQTIGSVAALEAIMECNRAKRGTSGLQGVDATNPPSFSFGNSTENKCLSTARLKISANGAPGELRVHALDHGQSPVLLSIETLRLLGAIIDFEQDLIVFRNLDATRIVRLTRGLSGHQLLDLTEDWLQNASQAERAVPSLSSYLKH